MELRHYLENIEHLLPRGIFKNSIRISQLPKEKIIIKLRIKQNYATKLADIASQITKDNKKGHNIVENLMLVNDTATIAAEIPVYLKAAAKNLTGHIDILQARYSRICILDFKPEKASREKAITQLSRYAHALSSITNIPLKHFRCAWFDNKNYYEFSPGAHHL